MITFGLWERSDKISDGLLGGGGVLGEGTGLVLVLPLAGVPGVLALGRRLGGGLVLVLVLLPIAALKVAKQRVV
jgi:hypothetical protein